MVTITAAGIGARWVVHAAVDTALHTTVKKEREAATVTGTARDRSSVERGLVAALTDLTAVLEVK